MGSIKLSPELVPRHFSIPNLVDLYLGDSAEILPRLDRCFDLIATDPPYGIRYRSNNRNLRFNAIHGDSHEVDIVTILKTCVSKLRRGRHVYCFGPSEYIRSIEQLSAHASLIWDKQNLSLGDLTLPRGQSHENINFAVYNISKANRNKGNGRLSARMRQGSVLRVSSLHSCAVKRHPTEKPVSLMRQIIESSSCLGETVVDPFMGSGSTIIAALLEGRRAVGVEKDPKYFRVAVKRVKKLLPTLDLFRTYKF